MFGYHATMIFRLILMILALSTCSAEVLPGLIRPQTGLFGILRSSPDAKTIHIINEWASSGISVRIITNSSLLNAEEQLWDLFHQSVQIRFMESLGPISHEIYLIDQKQAIWTPTLANPSDYPFFYPRFEADPKTLASLKNHFLDVWKSLSPDKAQLILQSLQNRSEDSTIVTPSVSLESTQASTSGPNSGFVASKNSKVFHPADSSEAKRILETNRVFFATEAEAIASGRRKSRR